MRTKGAKLNAKRGKQDDMGLASVPKRKKQGRARMAEIRDTEDASRPAIEARCRRAGKRATEENMREMRAQWHGCKAGQAILAETRTEAERQRLWNAAQHVRMAYAAYCRAEGIPMPHATCLRILLPVEAMKADAASAPKDLRPEAERLEQARATWKRADAWLNRFGRHTAGITKRCVIEDVACENTTAMALALNVVADGLEGRK